MIENYNSELVFGPVDLYYSVIMEIAEMCKF
jgi:hypothetical protein